MRRFTTMAALCLASTAYAASMQDFAGMWTPDPKVTELRPTKGSLPAMKPDAQKMFDAFRASAAKGDRWFDNELDCLPIGMTRLMAESPFELVVDEKLVALSFEWNRHVHLALRRDQHLKEYDYPSYLGYTIARMKGETLELDSVYFNTDTVLDHSGLPHSDQLKVRQSLALRDANTLVNTMTIDDAGAFAAPWQTQITYKRLPAGAVLKEDVCVERRGITKLDAHKRRNEGLKQLGFEVE